MMRVRAINLIPPNEIEVSEGVSILIKKREIKILLPNRIRTVTYAWNFDLSEWGHGLPKSLEILNKELVYQKLKMGKRNLKSHKAGLIITYYFDSIGQFIATLTPSSTKLYTTLFIRAYRVCYSPIEKIMSQLIIGQPFMKVNCEII